MVKLSVFILLSWALYAGAAPTRVKRDSKTNHRNPDSSMLTLAAPTSPPSGASREIALDFASFSIEWVDMLDYLGTPTNPSSFTINILRNLKDRTGVSPIIRSSGSSIDAFLVDHNSKLMVSAVNNSNPPDFVLSTKTSYRPKDANIANPPDLGFFLTMALISLEVGTPWIVGLDFGQNDLANTVFVAQYGAAVLRDNLYAFELGNEPSQYGKSYQGFRDGNTWSEDTYIQQNGEWTADIEKAVSTVMTNLPDGGLFQGGALCCGWKSHDLIQAGFFDKAASTKSISEHHYWGGCPNNVSVILDHEGIKASLAGRIGNSISLADAAQKDYILGEFNSFLHGGCDGASNTFGASLFGVDILMWTASINVKRAHLHSSSFTAYSVWYGGDNNTAGALYYSYLMVAEAIGDAGNTRMIELDTNTQSISGYAFYDGHDLARIALINHDIVQADGTPDNGASPITITINGPSGGSNSAKAKFLAADHTFVTDRITWGGQTMRHSPDGSLQGSETIHTLRQGSDPNTYLITLDPSSAALIFF